MPVLPALLATDLQHDYVRTCVTEMQDANIDTIHELAREMESLGRKQLLQEGLPEQRIRIRCSADMRYSGQSFQLEVPVTGKTTLEDMETAFHESYQNVYGYNRREKPVELVYLRAVASGIVDKPVPTIKSAGMTNGGSKENREIYFDGRFHGCNIYERSCLDAGTKINGPAVIQEYGSTTVLPPGWQASPDEFGNLYLTRIQE